MTSEEETTGQDEQKIVVPVPSSPEEFDELMFKLGEKRREIDMLELHRNRRVADIDEPYSKARAPLERDHDAMFDAAYAYAADPANKGRMTTVGAPQTADLVHSKVKYTDDHTGAIELVEGVTEDQAIRALRHRKGGGVFYKTTRKLIWGVIRAKTNEQMILGMKHYFVRNFNPTTVALYVKPATTPKPEGKIAEVQVTRYR